MVFLQFSWIGARYSPPVRDERGELTNSEISYADGKIHFKFTRKRTKPAGSQGHSFGDSGNQCFYLLFPMGGGSVNGGFIRKHDQRPETSANRICIRSCAAAELGNHLLQLVEILVW